jgi:tetratricopeptide (TPR) repeat protein
VDPGAHDAYLRGRYFVNRPSDENLERAIEQFEEAVALDSTFAPAYSGLSDAYAWAGYNEGFITAVASRAPALEAADKAVALDPNSAEAHTSLAIFKVFYDRDWSGGEAEFRRAFELNPSYSYARSQFAAVLALAGRYEESAAESRIAAELDPLNPQVFLDAEVAPILQGDLDRVAELARRAAELDPTSSQAAEAEGWARLEVGGFDEAVPFYERARSLGAPSRVTAYLAYAYGAAGDRANALRVLDALREVSPGGQVAPFNLAVVYLGLGDHDRALDELERARAANSEALVFIRQDAIFNPLRSDPRFVALLRELGFADQG